MKRNLILALALVSPLAMAGCASPESGGEAQGRAPSVFSAGDEASLRLAEEVSVRYLREVQPALLAGSAGVRVRAVHVDELGQAHARVPQLVDDVPVFGGELIVHLAEDGQVRSVTDGRVRDIAVDTTPDIDAEEAIDRAVSANGGWARVTRQPAADLQILKRDGAAHLTYRVQLAQLDGADTPAMPVVFVSARTGEIVWQYDNLETARNRKTYTTNHSTSLPGTLVLSESSGSTSDTVLQQAHDNAGLTYDYYYSQHGRDSFDGAGATLTSTVHYSNNYVNAFWDGSQMVYGDGDNSYSTALTVLDVVGHELTHAVTENASNLIYSGESGGLNESMSDMFGAAIEAYNDGGVSADTWKLGEDCWTPGTPGDALRYMNDPASDGDSLDYYTSSAGSVDVHYSSGISNLAFYLMTAGGTHPTGKSSNVVPALDAGNAGNSISKAAKIFYRANTVYLTPSSGFPEARTATIDAATDLFGAGSAEVESVSQAWTAVGVAAPVDYTVLAQQSGLSGASGSTASYSYATPAGAVAMKFDIAGGSGDADMYVKLGSPPTTSSYDCRPYLTGNSETCTFNPSQQGTYYVMIRGYSSYSGVTLTVSYAGGSAPTPEVCDDGADNDGDGAADCDDSDCSADPACSGSSPVTYTDNGVTLGANAWKYYAPFSVTPGTQLYAFMDRLARNPDLYVRWDGQPTTSTWDCRPYLGSNYDEVCDMTVPAGVTTAYVGVRARTNKSGTKYNLSVTYTP